MHKQLLPLLTLLPLLASTQVVYQKETLYSSYAMDNSGAQKRRQVVEDHANSLINLPIGRNDEESYRLEIALWNMSQFMVRTPAADEGIGRLLKRFDELGGATQRALLEVVYGQYANEFIPEVKKVALQTSHPKTYSMAAVHIYRAQPNSETRDWIAAGAKKIKTDEKGKLLLATLLAYIQPAIKSKLPELADLLAHQQAHGFKMIYAFHRSNRNYPGIAIVQNADGSFVQDSTGQTACYMQLARSASNLPYFITNGSSPQGLYSIRGTAVSGNVFIGPTPNLQTAMPYEVPLPEFIHYFPIVQNAGPERVYRSYFPESWQEWHGLLETFSAGKIGRSEIIVHGSTIDPEWFAGRTFYPLSPTLGCLNGLDLWNKQTGRLERSDQLALVNAFMGSPGKDGFLLVINVDDANAPVTVEMVRDWVEKRAF